MHKFDYENPSIESLIDRDMLNPKEFAQDTPLNSIRSDYFYTIKKECFKDVTTDDTGANLNSRSNQRVYTVGSFNDGKLQIMKIFDLTITRIFIYKSRNGRNYAVVNVNAKEVYTIKRYYRKSKFIKGLKRMIVRIKRNYSNSHIPYIGLIYQSFS